MWRTSSVNKNTLINWLNVHYFCKICSALSCMLFNSNEQLTKMAESEPSSYMISLDKMDHNFLAGINLNNNDSATVPLWSKTNYDDYYEFEIRASRIVKDEVSPTYKCHICNINVPIAYKKEHNDSTKHKTCLKITDIALKRVQLFMTQDNSNASDKNYNTYFCAPCATEVPLKDKGNHETTKQHAISVKHDFILKDFLIFYINDAKSDDYIKAVNDYTDNVAEVKTDSDIDSHTIEITATNGSIISVPFNHFHGYFKIGKHLQCRVCKVLIEDKHKISHILTQEHTDTVMVPIKDVHCIRTNDDIWSHCILCNEIIMDVQLHKLASSHNDKLKEGVKLNTEKSQTSFETTESLRGIYNGISDNGTEFTSCDICDLYIPVATMKSHVRGMKHKNKVTQNTSPKIQFNGSDKLRYLIKLNENNEVICKVCSVKFDNIDEHVATKDHTSKYNDLLETNTLTQYDDRFHCEVCDAYLIECYELFHINGKKHVKMLNKRNTKLKKERTEPSVSKLYSVAASITEPNNNSISQSHVESNKTSTPSTSQLNSNVLKSSSESHVNTTSNSSIETINTMSKCNKSYILTTSELNMLGSSLAEAMSDYIFEKLYETPSDLNLCYSKSVSESSFKTSEMGPSETASVSNDQNSDTFGPTVSNKDTSNNGTYFCETCKINVPNIGTYIYEHIDGRKHKLNVKRQEAVGEGNDISSSITTIHTLDNTDNTNYYCKPCNVNLTNNDSNIREHKAGNKHKSNEQRLKESQEIKPKIETINPTVSKEDTSTNNDNRYFCETCKVHVPNSGTNIYEHINGSKHKMNVTLKESVNVGNDINSLISKIQTSDNKESTNYYCKPCNVNLTNTDSNIKEHKAGNKHKSNEQRLKEALEIKPKIETINNTNKEEQNKIENNHNEFKVNNLFKVINNHNLYCKVCKIFIKNTFKDMNGHLISINHLINYDTLLLINKVWLRTVDNRYICDFCKNETTNYNEIDHIFGKQHAANVMKSTSTEIDVVKNEPEAVIVKKVRVRGKKKKPGGS